MNGTHSENMRNQYCVPFLVPFTLLTYIFLLSVWRTSLHLLYRKIGNKLLMKFSKKNGIPEIWETAKALLLRNLEIDICVNMKNSYFRKKNIKYTFTFMVQISLEYGPDITRNNQHILILFLAFVVFFKLNYSCKPLIQLIFFFSSVTCFRFEVLMFMQSFRGKIILEYLPCEKFLLQIEIPAFSSDIVFLKVGWKVCYYSSTTVCVQGHVVLK